MSKNVAVFVDVANLYYSARSLEVDVDYVALLKAATKGRDLIRAYAYSGLDPENENQRKFIDFLGKNDYKVVHKDIRKFGDGRVKANLDIELVVDLFRLADRMDIAVIVSGDGDFAPAIRALQDKGVRCEVISFRPNTSSDLLAVADEFTDMMKIIGIGRGKDADKASKVMSSPPMPAKEVVPEFGFREAPASVAAAAMAAIRDGKDGQPAARGRGRGRTRPEAPPTAEPAGPVVEETPVPAADAATETVSGEAHRRRRRRGGRGRGRGRGREGEAVTTAAPAAGEIGWAELDDISQVGVTESDDISQVGVTESDERPEYTFEEADAATLAELGLVPTSDGATPAPAEAHKPPRSRTRRAATEAKPATAETVKPRRGRSRPAAEEAPAPAAEAPKPRRRAVKPPVDAADAPSEAPKPRTRARAKPAAAPTEAPADAAGPGEEGIWQRFRSARSRTP